MAAPSRPPTFRAYGGDPHCMTCGKRLSAKDPAWFRGFPLPAGVFCDAKCYRARAR